LGKHAVNVNSAIISAQEKVSIVEMRGVIGAL
jgi:hypothetical protein